MLDSTLDEKSLALARRPVGIFGKLTRLTEVVRHYQASQMARRAVNVLRSKIQPGKLIGQLEADQGALRDDAFVMNLARQIVELQHDHPSHNHCVLGAKQFVMLNKRVSMEGDYFNREVLAQQSHLWRFQFHYHEFLLAQAQQNNWNEIALFLDAWLTAFAPEQTKRSEDAWHPFCISRRIVAWIWLLHASRAAGQPLEQELSQRLVESIIQQCKYLSSNLERDLGGNHLLENASALAIAGGTIASSHAAAWRKLAAIVFAVELPKQVLGHGEHFELAPMYHCQILSNLLRIEACCREDHDLQKVVKPSIAPMLKFLRSIVHPDGEIPLFADSGFHESPSVEEIAMVANENGHELGTAASTESLEPIGGYHVFRGSETFAICDFGPIAATNLPAHGHCDVGTLEVSIEGKRWIVDSGNFNYDDDSMRHYCRGSIAHNVATIDDENQANVWSKFRMGNRPNVFDHQHGRLGEFQWASVSHDGYRRLGVPKVTRICAFHDRAIICFDRGVPVSGSGQSIVGYLHLHPEVSVSPSEETLAGYHHFSLTRGGVRRDLAIAADTASIESGWFCSGFGNRQVAPVVRYVRAATGDLSGWILHEFGTDLPMQCSQNSIQVTMGSLAFAWTDQD